jgi:hypothetical protein
LKFSSCSTALFEALAPPRTSPGDAWWRADSTAAGSDAPLSRGAMQKSGRPAALSQPPGARPRRVR